MAVQQMIDIATGKIYQRVQSSGSWGGVERASI